MRFKLETLFLIIIIIKWPVSTTIFIKKMAQTTIFIIE